MKEEIFRKQFLELLVALLENGFSMQESIAVMKRSGQFSEGKIQAFLTSLEVGANLATCFEKVGFLPRQVTQIRLAEIHGDLQHTLATILQHMKLFEKQQKELRKVIAYPILLLCFVFALLFGMRLFLLPPLLQSGMIDDRHWGVLFLAHGPFLLAGLLVGSVGLIFLIWHYLKRKTAIERAELFAAIPIFASFFKLYQTSYFALEWGRLFKQGLEAHQILEQMIAVEDNLLLTMVAQQVHQGMTQGQTLSQQLVRYPFLMPEFPLIIYQGEVKGQLGEELLIYSQLLLNNLVLKVEKSIQWIQPIIFLLIAVLILAIYMAMLLPMYGNLGGI